MKVIICEDDLSQRQLIEHEVIKYTTFHLPSVEVVLCASNAEEVINYMSNKTADCYFLDIGLGGNMNGLELASIIREKEPLASIIFITTFADKLKLTFKYKIAALDYIIKTSNKEKFLNNIIDTLNIAYQRYLDLGQNNTVNVLQIKIGERILNLKYDDIIYFETSATVHKLILHSKNGIYEFYGRLKDMEKLDDRFCRCHNSYLVNIHHLKEYLPKKRSLIMSNGHECLVSHRYSKNIKKHNHS